MKIGLQRDEWKLGECDCDGSSDEARTVERRDAAEGEVGWISGKSRGLAP